MGASMITNDGIESHGYESNFGSNSDPQDDEDKPFDMEKKANISTASWMIVTYLMIMFLTLRICRVIDKTKEGGVFALFHPV
eukprot:9336598-Ditylum_brightwellii.AAC.1